MAEQQPALLYFTNTKTLLLWLNGRPHNEKSLLKVEIVAWPAT